MDITPAFEIATTIEYRPFRFPPRCRKARPVQELFTHVIAVPSVTGEMAPVVALVPNEMGRRLGSPGGGDAPLRHFEGRFYSVESRGNNPTAPAMRAGSDAFKATGHHTSFRNEQWEAIEEAAAPFKDILIIDGDIWKATHEPVYAITSMGLGGNHGGIYVDIDTWGRDSMGRRFPLTDYDGAVAEAIAFAEQRQDTGSIPRLRQTLKATIFDPSVFKTPTRESRIASAAADIQGLTASAVALLTGDLTRETMSTAKDLLEKASNVFWQHDIKTVPGAPAADAR